MNQTLQDIPLRRIDGAASSLSEFGGKVLLVVNVASECGLTPQYEALERLFERYRERGLIVLGFPANEFGAQEPGANAEIAAFCTTKFGVQFPMFEKVVVKGEGRHPLYTALVAAHPVARQKKAGTLRASLEQHGLLTPGKDDDILWNFEKFVVGRNGDVVARFAPDVEPEDPQLVEVIEGELAKT